MIHIDDKRGDASGGRQSILRWVNTAIVLVVMFGFGHLPAPEPVTAHGMALVGIFLGAVYGWVFIEIVWPSLIGLIALMLVGGMAPGELLAKSFGNPLVQMMFFIFVFCQCISHHGLSRFISLWFVSRRCLIGRPWLFTTAFLASMFVLGALTSSSPTALIGWAILYGVCETCGFRRWEAWPMMMIFAILYSAEMGMCMVPFKQLSLTVFGAYEAVSGQPFEYGGYIVAAFAASILCLAIIVLMARWVIRPDVSKLVDLDVTSLATREEMQLSFAQKLVLFFLVLLVAALFAPHFLPRELAVTRLLRGIGGTGCVILIVAIMTIIRVKEEPLLPFRQMTAEGVNWGVVFLQALVQPLAGALTAPDTGITAVFTQGLGPLFEGASSAVFAVGLSLAALVLTQFMNNVAIGVAFMPLLATWCASAGIDPEMPLTLMVLTVHIAFLTPASCACSTLLHANEWISERFLWKYSPLAIIVSWLAVVAVSLALTG